MWHALFWLMPRSCKTSTLVHLTVSSFHSPWVKSQLGMRPWPQLFCQEACYTHMALHGRHTSAKPVAGPKKTFLMCWALVYPMPALGRRTRCPLHFPAKAIVGFSHCVRRNAP